MLLRLLRRIVASPSLRNVGYLTVAQAANLLIPLLTLPWVLRALDPAGFGHVALWQAVVQYLALVVDFGFYLGATKQIAEFRNDRAAITELFYVVQTCRLLLALAATTISIVVMLAVPGLRDNADIFAASLLTLVGVLLTPLWLFAGLERMALAAIAAVAGRLATIPLILLFVHQPDHAWRVALIQSCGALIAGLACVYIIIHWKLVDGWARPSWTKIIAAYRGAWHYFVTTASASFYSTANPIVLGLVAGSLQVGLFSAADRVRIVSLTPIHPVFNAYYPVMSRLFSEDVPAGIRMLLRLAVVLMGGTLIVSAVLWFAAPLIVRILMGDGFEGAVGVLRIMAAVPFVIGVNTVLGPLGLLALGLKERASRIILLFGALNMPLLAGLGYLYGAQGAAASLLATELLVSVALGLSLFRHLGARAAQPPRASSLTR